MVEEMSEEHVNGVNEEASPVPPRRLNLRSIIQRVILEQRVIGAFVSKSYENMCDICKSLELEVEKFIIQDHSSDRDQQAYQSLLPIGKKRKAGEFLLSTGSEQYNLGTYSEIEGRSRKCPFCSLVIQSVAVFKYEGIDTIETAQAVCRASWQVDGREIIQDTQGESTMFRPRTRRIQLHWNNGIFDDSFLVLIAPENRHSFGLDREFLKSNTLFLGRHISSAGNNQALVKHWLDLCCDHHKHTCQIQSDPEFERMVSRSFFGVVDVLEMRLTTLPAGEKYIALSYVWGIGSRYMTTLANINAHQAYGGLEKVFAKLPRVIRDTIRLVRALGERYVWIDSLCIVQDSERSWNLNAAMMNVVYGNAHLTVCAADGLGATEGLKGLSPSERHVEQYSENCGQNLRLLLCHLAETYVNKSKWNTRAWTFQERLLSRRCLIFTSSRVFFQCHSATFSEDIVAERTTPSWSVELVQAPLQMLRDVSRRAFWVYTECVRLYTARDLGRDQDILAAFNGMSNLLGSKMESPLLFGLPSSHFDLALLWEPTSWCQRRSTNRNSESKVRHFGSKDFPSWSWCGWRGSPIAYREQTIGPCLADVHQWLLGHTWIIWHIRDGQGNLRKIWRGPIVESTQIRRWRGYGRVHNHEADAFGRHPRTESQLQEKLQFHRTLPEYPFSVGFAEDGTPPSVLLPDQRFLQFWTWSAYLRVLPRVGNAIPSKQNPGLARYDIADYTGDWCGTIVLDQSWSNVHQPGSAHEFLAISDAKDFTREEKDAWTYYIPKEKEQSEWDLYYVLLIQREADIARRVGLGKVFKEAFNNSCLPGKEWREIILD